MATDGKNELQEHALGHDPHDTDALIDAIDPNRAADLRTPGGRLKDLRERKGLSLRALAEMLDGETHFTTIAKLETGRMKMSLEWAEKLSAALQVQSSYFLTSLSGIVSTRTIDLFSIDEIKFLNEELEFGEPLGTTITPIGGANAFGLGVVLNIGAAPAEGAAIVDPDLKEVRTDKMYLVHSPGRPLAIYSFEGSPARFVEWLGGDFNTDLYIGRDTFAVAGTVVFICCYP